jgi:hypothetical protein
MQPYLMGSSTTRLGNGVGQFLNLVLGTAKSTQLSFENNNIS